MPTYEYHCDACDNDFEEFQSMMDKPLKKCPKCGKSKLRRLFGTGSAILFKGSGFYQPDYRSESYKAGAKADEQTAKPAATDGKTDSTSTSANGSSESSSKSAKKTSKSTAKVSDD